MPSITQIAIAASGDDGYQFNGVSSPNITATLVYVCFTNNWGCFRFLNVEVPADATIDSATLRWHLPSHTMGTCGFDLYGELGDAAVITTTSGDISSRSRTTASLSLSDTDFTTNQFNSIDVTTLFQEMVDDAGWASGNDAAFISDQTSGSSQQIRVSSYDSGSNYATFDCTYTAAGGGATPHGPLGHPLFGSLRGPVY